MNKKLYIMPAILWSGDGNDDDDESEVSGGSITGPEAASKASDFNLDD